MLQLSLAVLVGCSSNPTIPTPTTLRDTIVAKERQGLDALKVGDLATFARSTGDDAVFIDSHGIASKADVMKNVAGFKVRDYTIEDVTFTPPSASSGLIAYRITEDGNFPRQGLFRQGLRLIAMGRTQWSLGLCLQPGDCNEIGATF